MCCVVVCSCCARVVMCLRGDVLFRVVSCCVVRCCVAFYHVGLWSCVFKLRCRVLSCVVFVLLCTNHRLCCVSVVMCCSALFRV